MATQCTATSKRSGERCNRYAIEGGTVCIMHGGKAPNVKAAAAARLLAMIDPSLAVLVKTLSNEKRPELALKAATDVLDRNGFGAVQRFEDLTPADRLEPEERKERIRKLAAELLAPDITDAIQ